MMPQNESPSHTNAFAQVIIAECKIDQLDAWIFCRIFKYQLFLDRKASTIIAYVGLKDPELSNSPKKNNYDS